MPDVQVIYVDRKSSRTLAATIHSNDVGSCLGRAPCFTAKGSLCSLCSMYNVYSRLSSSIRHSGN